MIPWRRGKHICEIYTVEILVIEIKLNGQVKQQKTIIAERISDMNDRCEEITVYYRW